MHVEVSVRQHEPARGDAVHQRASCVAITTEVPSGGVRRTGAAAAARAAGSTLPVGSSARSSSGRAISARAMAARCFSPPERSGGRTCMRSPSPTQRRSSTTSRPIARLVAALHAQRQGDVLVGGEVIEQPEILEHHAHAPPQAA